MLLAVRPGVLAQPEFFRLWVGQSVSAFGDQVTRVALPLTAAVILGATPGQMGLLYAAQTAPTLLLSLFAGVWIDRHRRQPVLVVAHLGRGLLLAFVPIAVLLHVLRFEHLLLVAFAVGTLETFFAVAYLTYLPTLVQRSELVEANGKLQASYSVAQIAGPGVGGVLVQLLTAGVAIATDAISFLIAGWLIATIRHPEAPAPPRKRDVRAEILDGLRGLVGQPILRTLLVGAMTALFFAGMIFATEIVYLSRDLALDAVTIGLILAAGSFGALAGAVGAASFAARIGLGPSIIAATALFTAGAFALPLAAAAPSFVIPVLVAGQVAISFGTVIWNVNGPSLRQALTPDHLLGRVNASYRFLAWGSIPLGALIGGVLADAIGIRGALFVAAGGFTLALAWVLLSPLRDLRVAPEPQVS